MNILFRNSSIFLFFVLFVFTNTNAQNVSLDISNIRNKDGKLQVAIFQNVQQYDEEEAAEVFYFEKYDIENGEKLVKIDLKPGTYAITVMDDEDNSGDLTFRFGFFPLEGIGFSDFYLKKMKRPKFSDFSFVKKTSDLLLKVKMKYY